MNNLNDTVPRTHLEAVLSPHSHLIPTVVLVQHKLWLLYAMWQKCVFARVAHTVHLTVKAFTTLLFIWSLDLNMGGLKDVLVKLSTVFMSQSWSSRLPVELLQNPSDPSDHIHICSSPLRDRYLSSLMCFDSFFLKINSIINNEWIHNYLTF